MRTIATHFYQGRRLVKTNKASYANSAVLRCVDHMQLNSYGATSAEVFDEENGELHAVVTRSVNDHITIVYKREVQEGM